uniref:Uncharacterized protein n=1 Tax=Caenorhabditis tropicalis TaxID=1561998 RepID=A0A1I7USJ9_9PELO
MCLVTARTKNVWMSEWDDRRWSPSERQLFLRVYNMSIHIGPRTEPRLSIDLTRSIGRERGSSNFEVLSF